MTGATRGAEHDYSSRVRGFSSDLYRIFLLNSLCNSWNGFRLEIKDAYISMKTLVDINLVNIIK